MKFDELRDLKPGDEVVVEVQKIDQHDPNKTVNVGGWVFGGWIPNSEILKAYHEPAKIKMTVEEKREFDKLMRQCNTLCECLEFIDEIDCPNLYRKMFCNGLAVAGNNEPQLEFARAWGNPSLIEVEKEKTYYVHLFKSQSNGYLNQSRDSSGFLICDKSETERCKTQFTQSEIDELQKQKQFKAIDLNKCKEEVEDE